MPFQIIRGDITKIKCDAIVNSTNKKLKGTGHGVDGAIHAVAGPELQKECNTLGGCNPGEAKATKGYDLLCSYVIHTVGPVWRGGKREEDKILASCYRESLELAKKLGCESVAFPLIASGVFGYPKEKALSTALNEIGRFLMENEMLVYIVVFDKKSFRISKNIISDIKEFIDDNYVGDYDFPDGMRFNASVCRNEREARTESVIFGNAVEDVCMPAPQSKIIDEIISATDESFSQMLIRKIDEKGMTDPECYKKSNIDKKLFSKIRGDVNYSPKKRRLSLLRSGFSLIWRKRRNCL